MHRRPAADPPCISIKAAQVVDICQEDVLQHLVSLVACQCLTVAGSALTPSPRTCPLADRARYRPLRSDLEKKSRINQKMKSVIKSSDSHLSLASPERHKARRREAPLRQVSPPTLTNKHFIGGLVVREVH